MLPWVVLAAILLMWTPETCEAYPYYGPLMRPPPPPPPMMEPIMVPMMGPPPPPMMGRFRPRNPVRGMIEGAVVGGLLGAVAG